MRCLIASFQLHKEITRFLRHSTRASKRAPLGTRLDIHCARGITSTSLPQLLSRSWLLETPATKVSIFKRAMTFLWWKCQTQLSLTQVRTVAGHTTGTSFQVIQDDLLHPVLGGNKLRKLDALLPALEQAGVRHVVQQVPHAHRSASNNLHYARLCMRLGIALLLHIIHTAPNHWYSQGRCLRLSAFLQVTCGGLQSAHCAAVAAACAERGMRAHLLVRGERPKVCLAPVHALSNDPHSAMASRATRRGCGSEGCCHFWVSTWCGGTGSGPSRWHCLKTSCA